MAKLHSDTDRQSSGDQTAWIPLMDYAIKKGVSLSTLRRHIKANKIRYRVENGRYLVPDDSRVDLRDDSSAAPSAPAKPSVPQPQLLGKLQRLERDLAKAHEEIAELKMLIALYEEKMAPQRLDS